MGPAKEKEVRGIPIPITAKYEVNIEVNMEDHSVNLKLVLSLDKYQTCKFLNGNTN